MRTIQVFKAWRYVGRRNNPQAPSRFVAEIVARGTGTLMYESKVCDTKDEARKLCERYMARNPQFIDTTKIGHWE